MKFINELSKGKLLGHPMHVMLVHFPLALFPVSLIFDILAYTNHDPSLALMSFYSMGAGTIGAYLAATFGMMDLLRLPDDKIIWRKALIHGSINGVLVFSYTIMAVLRMKEYPEIKIPSLMEILFNGALTILLLIGAHYGGELVYRHKIGTIKTKSGDQ